jgi:hypothetical protein
VEVKAHVLQDLHGGIMNLLYLVFRQKLVWLHYRGFLHVDALKLEIVSGVSVQVSAETELKTDIK